MLILDVNWYDIGGRNLGNLVNIDLSKILCEFVEDEKYIIQTVRDKLVNARNKFGHPGEKPHLSLREANATLQTYLESALEYILWLEKSSLPKPIAVVIKSVKSTKHGYYEIETLKSSGIEMIYMPLGTEKEFEIGETWYIIPYSNPIRIEPLMFKY